MEDTLQHKVRMLKILQNELVDEQQQYQEKVKIFLESPSEEDAKKIMQREGLTMSAYESYIRDREALATFLKNYPWGRIALERSIGKLREEISQMVDGNEAK